MLWILMIFTMIFLNHIEEKIKIIVESCWSKMSFFFFALCLGQHGRHFLPLEFGGSAGHLTAGTRFHDGLFVF